MFKKKWLNFISGLGSIAAALTLTSPTSTSALLLSPGGSVIQNFFFSRLGDFSVLFCFSVFLYLIFLKVTTR